MKLRFVIGLLVLLGVAPIHAHVGSPNVFFDGPVGAHRAFVVIRPPATLPGAAQVSVRIVAADIQTIAVRPVLPVAGQDNAPQPVIAQPVRGESNFWSAEVWLLRPGSYTMEINVAGTRGAGQVAVPVQVQSWRAPEMTAQLRVGLLLLGSLLFAGVGIISQAIAREGRLEVGRIPAARDGRRGRWAAVIVLVLVASGVVAGAARWRTMDWRYRTQGLQKPEPVAAFVRSEPARLILELRQSEASAGLSSWAALVPDHGKLMHLFLVREPEWDVFAHLHPVRTSAGGFGLELPAFPAGRYSLYGDVTFESGLSQTLVAEVDLPSPRGALWPRPPRSDEASDIICGFPQIIPVTNSVIARDRDDSWHFGAGLKRGTAETLSPSRLGGVMVSPLMGGYTMVFENAAEVAAGRATLLRFAAFDPEGREAPLQLYMGMSGHAVVRRTDGAVFAHLHPAGSFSMAAYELFRSRDGDGSVMASPASVSHRVEFPYEFPQPGQYRVWVQVLVAGQVLTGVFDIAAG